MIVQKTCPVCFYYPSERHEEPSKVKLFVTRITPRYHHLHLDIFLRARGCGHDVTIVDVSQFNYPQQSRTLEQTGTMDQFAGVQELVTLRPKWGNWSSAKDQNSFSGQSDSMRSEIRTKYGGRANILSEKLDATIISFLSSELFNQLPNNHDQSEIWILTNGRLAHQRAIVARAEGQKIRTLYLEEIGFPPGYFLRPYPPHDRLLLQKDVLTYFEKTSPRDRQLAASWFEERSAPGSKLNQYSKLFRTVEKLHNESARGQRIGFFTSSSDELLGLGSAWTDSSWESQYEAFAKIVPVLQKLGYDLYLRVHPNFANKSTRDLKIEFRQIQKFANATKLRIVGPQSEKKVHTS